MFTVRASFLVLASALLLGYVHAQTSLYIPGFDPQPVSASQLGIGADGRTTWELKPGVTSGTFDEIGFIGTATLVEGPNDAHLVYSDAAASFVVEENCSINGGVAVCSIVIASGTSTETALETESVIPFEVQGGGAAPSAGSSPAVSTPAPSGGSSASSVVSRSSGSPVASQTSAGSPSPSTSTGAGTNNGAVTQLPSLSVVAGAIFASFALWRLQ
ncbi:hypothetical protein NLI96_g9988 [Meripilus lineatus]|uniref:Uncharacterized protein n=1 Tax=Meripilus lineatus TaxID=2056292 RepID=A0AAD5UUF9_9APHY|nr:hypothetical protein NLI96_g9988 [Physisporinus lineatus]